MNGLDERGKAAPVRILLADDDPLAAAFVQQLLAPQADLRVVGVAKTLQELYELLASERPQLVLTETTLAGESVLDELPRLFGGGQGPHIAVLTTDSRSQTVLRSVAAGANSYVLKDRPFAELVDQIRACAAGVEGLDERLIPVVLRGYRDLAAGVVPARGRSGESTISERALAVLELMAEGLRNRDIAERLGLSEHTVKVYVGQVFAYFGVSDRTSAVMQALERGLVQPPLRSLRPAR